MHAEYARLYVKVLKTTMEYPHEHGLLRISVGHQRCKCRQAELDTMQPFLVSLTYHANLFYMVQVDYFQTNVGIFKQRRHRGRAQIRVRLLHGLMPANAQHDIGPDMHDANSYTGWWEFRERDSCFLPLDELGVLPGDPRRRNAVGAVKLALKWVRVPYRQEQIVQMTAEALGRVVQAERLVDTAAAARCPDSPLSVSTTGSSSIAIQGADCINSAVALERSLMNLSGRAAFFQRLASAFISGDEFRALMAVQALVTAFNQGVEVGSVYMTRAFVLLQRYYALRPAVPQDHISVCTAPATVPVQTVRIGAHTYPLMDRQRFGLARTLYRYVIASYGWMGVNYAGKGRGIFADGARSQADAKAACEFLRLPAEHLLHGEFQSKGAFRPVHLVAYDRQLSAVVIAIRGTMHANDALTDLVCDYIPWDGSLLAAPDADTDAMGFVHSGILGAARWVLERSGRGAVAKARELRARNIYVCGHSLGGGTAMVLALLLRGLAPGFRVYCSAYGPPPILSDSFINMNPDMADFIDVVVNEDDGVPRLCYGTAVDLQSLVVYTSLISSSAWAFGSLPEAVVARIDECREIVARRSCSVKLFHPGRVHHVVSVGTDKYAIQVPHDYFNELRVANSTLFAHLPDYYAKSMDRVYIRYLLSELELRKLC